MNAKFEEIAALAAGSAFEEEGVRAIRIEVGTLYATFKANREAILADEHRSELGKQTAIAAAARKTETAVLAIRARELANIAYAESVHQAEIERSLAVPDPARLESDPNGAKALLRGLAKELRASDVRRDLASLSPLEMASFYGACQDPEIVSVIEQAPARIQRVKDGVTLAPWIPAEAIAVRRLSAARASSPEAAERLRVLETLRTGVLNILDGTAATLARGLGAARPIGNKELRQGKV